MALLEAQNLRKLQGSEVILDDVSLAITHGELVCIMGASGSGKSTLLNLLAGLDQPSGGRILFDGEDLATKSSAAMARFRREKAAFIFQQHNLLPALTALENVMLPLQLAGVRNARERALAALSSVKLDALAARLPATLSGGETQRVAIARSLAQETDVVFADEPTASLDLRAGETVMDLLMRARTKTRAVVVVTHDERVARLADRVMVVREGQVHPGWRWTDGQSGVRLCA